MADKDGVGVTVVSHDSENRTLVDGFQDPGSYSCNVTYQGTSLLQLTSLTASSAHCEQFIMYECYQGSFAMVTAGGYHVMEKRWSTGEEWILSITNAHAAWTIHVQTLSTDVTATNLTNNGERTVVYLLTSPGFPWSNWGLEIPALQKVIRDTTHLESWSVWDSYRS